MLLEYGDRNLHDQIEAIINLQQFGAFLLDDFFQKLNELSKGKHVSDRIWHIFNAGHHFEVGNFFQYVLDAKPKYIFLSIFLSEFDRDVVEGC